MAEADALNALKEQVDRLSRRVEMLEAVHEVRTLHFKYGYYLDACQYDLIVDLFSERAELRFMNGVYRGKAGVRRLYCEWLRNVWASGSNGPKYGVLYDHLMLQDVITVAEDGLSAKGRLRGFMQGGWHETNPDPPKTPPQIWEAGVYENEYVKEDGAWKFRLFDYNMLWQANYEPGWSHSGVHLKPLTRTYPDDPTGPDELRKTTPVGWPQTRIVPFHYPHPVTGEPWKEDDE